VRIGEILQFIRFIKMGASFRFGQIIEQIVIERLVHGSLLC